MLLTLLGLFALVCNVAYPLPQLRRLWTTRDVSGIAPTTIAASLVGGTWWSAYALSLGDVPAILACVFATLVQSSLLVLLARSGGLDLRRWLPGVVALASLAVLVWWSPVVVGVMANCVSAARALPQLWTALRGRTPLSGCSLGSWVLVEASAVSWLVYGLCSGQPLLGAAYVVTIPAAAIIIAQLIRSRRAAVPDLHLPHPRREPDLRAAPAGAARAR